MVLANGKQYGLIAQEVEEVLPELVKSMKIGDDQEFKSVNYNAHIPILIKAMKEQQEEIENLKNKLKNR